MNSISRRDLPFPLPPSDRRPPVIYLTLGLQRLSGIVITLPINIIGFLGTVSQPFSQRASDTVSVSVGGHRLGLCNPAPLGRSRMKGRVKLLLWFSLGLRLTQNGHLEPSPANQQGTKRKDFELY